MEIKITKDALLWLCDNDLWALVNNQMNYYIGESLFDYLENITEDEFKIVPDELNIRNSIFYLKLKIDSLLLFLLFQKTGAVYELIKIITQNQMEYNHFK